MKCSVFPQEKQTCLLLQGRGIFASGSPFDKVVLADGRTFYPGQGNNAYVFPGVALGVIACGVRHISDDVFLTSAEVRRHRVTRQPFAVRLLLTVSSYRFFSCR